MEIKVSKRGKILIGVSLVVLLGLAWMGVSQLSNAVEVDLYTVDKGLVKTEISADGVIDSDKVSTIYSLGNGEILEVNVDIGDYVEKGDLIAKIDQENIEFQIEGIDAQIANLDYMLKEALKPADRERVRNLEIAINTANTSLNRSDETIDKLTELYTSDAISLEELNNAKDQNVILNNQVLSLNNDLMLLKKSVSGNIKMQYNSQILSLEANKKALSKALDNSEIKAKISGIITEKYVKDGKYLMQGSPVVEITDISKVKIIVDVLESEVNDITLDLETIVEDLIKDEYVDAKIVKIYPKIYEEFTELGIKQKKVNIELKPSKFSQGHLLNQEVGVKFITEKKEDVIRIPIESYFSDNKNFFVFINNNGTVAIKEVKLGLIGDDYVEIVKGLKVKDKIIETLDNDLTEGMKVK